MDQNLIFKIITSKSWYIFKILLKPRTTKSIRKFLFIAPNQVDPCQTQAERINGERLYT